MEESGNNALPADKTVKVTLVQYAELGARKVHPRQPFSEVVQAVLDKARKWDVTVARLRETAVKGHLRKDMPLADFRPLFKELFEEAGRA